MTGESFFTFRGDKELLNYAAQRVERLRDEIDRVDALQEAWADLLKSECKTLEEAKEIFNRAISRIGMRAIRHNRRMASVDDMDYIDLGDGNYQRRPHMGSAD